MTSQRRLPLSAVNTGTKKIMQIVIFQVTLQKVLIKGIRSCWINLSVGCLVGLRYFYITQSFWTIRWIYRYRIFWAIQNILVIQSQILNFLQAVSRAATHHHHITGGTKFQLLIWELENFFAINCVHITIKSSPTLIDLVWESAFFFYNLF